MLAVNQLRILKYNLLPYRYLTVYNIHLNDVLVNWYIGVPVVHWYTGTLRHQYTGIVVHWYINTLVYRYIDRPSHWYIGVSAHLYNGTLVH